MKHIIVVNPAAGPKNSLDAIRAEVESLSGYDTQIYETKGKGDAFAFVRAYCREHKDERVRFYACGGDGTLGEVAGGVYGAENASISCYPCGSGNDFVKYYGGKDHFLSFAALFEGEEREIDMVTDGERFSINVANFGFDYFVCEKMEKLRRKKGFGGKRAYYGGIVYALFHAMKNNARVFVDGEQVGGEALLLCTASNGSYVGSSFQCAPYSDNEDGLLEVCYVKPISVFKLIRLIGKYKRGEHLDDEKMKPLLHYARAREVRVESTDERFGYCLDGEMIPSKSFTLKIIPKALRFAVPKTVAAELHEKDAQKAAALTV